MAEIAPKLGQAEAKTLLCRALGIPAGADQAEIDRAARYATNAGSDGWVASHLREMVTPAKQKNGRTR